MRRRSRMTTRQDLYASLAHIELEFDFACVILMSAAVLIMLICCINTVYCRISKLCTANIVFCNLICNFNQSKLVESRIFIACTYTLLHNSFLSKCLLLQGKFIRINFDISGYIAGANIETCILYFVFL